MPGEVFGEADIILRGRLDLLQRDLDQAEMLVVGQQDRLQQAHAQTASSARSAAAESEKSGSALGKIVTIIGSWRLLSAAVSGGSVALAAVPAIAVAAKVALVGLATGGVLVVATAIGMVLEVAARAERAMRNIGKAARELDGSTQRTRELADALREIPIVGRLAATAFSVFSGNAVVADEALTGLVATVEDGQVKIGFFSRMLGRTFGANGVINDIDAINEKLAEMNAELGQAAQFQGFAGPQAGRLDASSLAAGRANELEGLGGTDRVRAENRIRHEEAVKFTEDERIALNAKTAAMFAGIRAQEQAEEITAKQARRMREVVSKSSADAGELINAREVETQKELAELGSKRLDAAQKLASTERNRVASIARAAEMEAGGDRLGAELEMLKLRRREALGELDAGQHDQLNSINRYYAARESLARDANQRELDAERDQQQRKQEVLDRALQRQRLRDATEGVSRAQRLASLGTDARANEQQLQGRDFDAQRTRTREGFDADLINAQLSGDGELVKALERSRDVQLLLIDQSERESILREAEKASRDLEKAVSTRGPEARQIDAARELAGGAGGKSPELQQAERQTKSLEEIRKNTKQKTVARAG